MSPSAATPHNHNTSQCSDDKLEMYSPTCPNTTRAVKKPKTEHQQFWKPEAQLALNDYGTLASQRPRRMTRPPQRFQDITSKASQKSKPQRCTTTNKYGFRVKNLPRSTTEILQQDANHSVLVSPCVGPQLQPSTPAHAPQAENAFTDDPQCSEGQTTSQTCALQTLSKSPKIAPHTAHLSYKKPHCTPDYKSQLAISPHVPEYTPRSDDSNAIFPDLPQGDSLYRPHLTDTCSEGKIVIEDHVELVDGTTDSDRLRALAEQLTQRSKNLPKPPPAGAPEVWAEGRQELCETLHYYRAYQSACYSTGGFARGFMFDKVAHPRDYTDSSVVLSRAGGGQTKDKDTGEMSAGKDQVEDTVAQSLRNCKSHFNPVVILAGADNPHMPSHPPHQYCVLDYFKPTHIWTEKQGQCKIVRYRFEKMNEKKQSWWRPKDSTELVELGSLAPPIEQTCPSCAIMSVQIYLDSWMCLQPSCNAFWKINGHGGLQEPEEKSLIYDPRFLKQKTPWPNEDHDYPLVSNNAELSSSSILGEDSSEAFWLGVVCPDCGRCNSRLSWMGWECANPTCTYKKDPPHTIIPGLSLREPVWPVTNSYTLSRDVQSPLIDVHVSFSHGYRINRYRIPGIDGFITHMIANRTVVEEPGGPDDMFEELQRSDIGLRRCPMPNAQLKGSNYCRQFLVNYGMPYKFIAATSSRPFDGAARPITATRSRLNWAAKLLLAQESSQDSASGWSKEREFNEVLALGYFESQKINYHDDGEHGLGPTIATLSLGAPGKMRVRMKARHYHGVSAAGVYDDAPPLPGCQHYAARKARHADLAALKTKDAQAYQTARKKLPQELKLKSRGNAKEVLTMQLGHGDVVVMHGAQLQRYYEHAVDHAGKLRFALTCRYIDPASLGEADRPEYEVGGDEEGYDGGGLLA